MDKSDPKIQPHEIILALDLTALRACMHARVCVRVGTCVFCENYALLISFSSFYLKRIHALHFLIIII